MAGGWGRAGVKGFVTPVLLNIHMRYREIMLEVENPFDAAHLGTILVVGPKNTFGASTHVMKMADGSWQTVHPSGGRDGVQTFTLGADTVDLAALRNAAAESRIGLVLDGVQRGQHIKTGVQVMALPIGASVVYPATGSRSVRTDSGMIQDGKQLPYAAYTATNALWESVMESYLTCGSNLRKHHCFIAASLM